MSITVGYMRDGFYDGFARQIESNGSCKIGWWRTLQITNTPPVRKPNKSES